jgi:hypothetical protein
MTCSVDGCERPAIAHAFCERHYRRYRKYGSPLTTKKECHGKTGTPEYKIWKDMIKRCNNPNDRSYSDYGGRGIFVCERWRNSFVAFLEDMGNRPEGAQIDQIDNSIGYCKENCRWTSCAKNNQNRRSTKLTEQDVENIRAGGKSPRQISEEFNISLSQAYRVLNNKRWVKLKTEKGN